MAGALRRSYLQALTDEEKEFIRKEIAAIGADESVFVFRDFAPTSYSDIDDIIHISASVFPSTDGNNPIGLMSVRAALAHEYYGHRTHRNTRARKNSWNDEFRAHYCAAIKAPGLTDEDRTMLMSAAVQCAKDAGVDIHINAVMRRVLYGY